MLIAQERETRAAHVDAINGLVEDTTAELGALLVEYLSLAAVEAQQRETIDKLLDGAPNGM